MRLFDKQGKMTNRWLVFGVVPVLLGVVAVLVVACFTSSSTTLPHTARNAVKSYYDTLGWGLELIRLFEDPVTDVMVDLCDIQPDHRVFELGHGTGFLAERLLRNKQIAGKSGGGYNGVDISPTMHDIVTKRLADYIRNGTARLSLLPGDSQSFKKEILGIVGGSTVDRFISSYVIDLLSDEDIQEYIDGAVALLKPGGKCCLTSITHPRGEGASVAQRLFMGMWELVYKYTPFAGGCRPVDLHEILSADRHNEVFKVEHHHIVTVYGLVSEVIVVNRK